MNQTKKRGRPPGSKTRPDAPSKLKKSAGNVPMPPRDANGHFIPKQPATAPAAKPEAAPVDPGASAGTVPPLQNDTSIFGDIKPPEDKLPETEPSAPGETGTGGNAPEPPPGDGGEPKQDRPPQPEATPESHRPFATMIFDTAASLLATFVGKFWLPRPCGKNPEAGEIPYDEKEMVVSAMMRYFLFIGLTILSPLQELQMAILAYCAPRFADTVIWIKSKFAKKPKPVNPTAPGDTRFAGSPPPAGKPEPETTIIDVKP